MIPSILILVSKYLQIIFHSILLETNKFSIPDYFPSEKGATVFKPFLD